MEKKEQKVIRIEHNFSPLLISKRESLNSTLNVTLE